MPTNPLSASAKGAESVARPAVDSPSLYNGASYSAWSRNLYRLMPLQADARLLFESTIEEPTALLSALVSGAFDGRPTDRYTSVFGRGNPYLISAVAARYGAPERAVLTTTGVANGLSQVLAAFIQPGDGVLIETPGFDVLGGLTEAAGGVAMPLVRAAPDFDLTADALREALTPGVRMAVITNLHNPSGRRLSEEAVLDLARAAAEKGAWLVIDEVYADFARLTVVSLPAAPNLIRLNSLAKVFGLYGLRCGWILADPTAAARIAAANATREFGVSKLTHAVSALILENPDPFEAHWRTVLAERRPILERHLAAMRADGLLDGAMPEFGCMAFPRVVRHADTLSLAERLWREDGLVTAPGEMFGLPGYMRLGIGLSPELMDEGLSRLHEALKR